MSIAIIYLLSEDKGLPCKEKNDAVSGKMINLANGQKRKNTVNGVYVVKDLNNGHQGYIALKCFPKGGLTYILYFSKVLKIQSCDDFEYLSCIVCRISIPQRNSYFNKPLKIIQMDSFPRESSSCFFCKEVFLNLNTDI